MKFKSDREKEEFEKAPVVLKLIAKEFSDLSDRFGKEAVVTRILDPVAGESGVHLDYRAIDFRDYHESEHLYNIDERLALVSVINALFPRNDGFKTCLHHGGTAEHFHIQVPQNIKNLSSGPK
jgi:hypothetical protein